MPPPISDSILRCQVSAAICIYLSFTCHSDERFFFWLFVSTRMTNPRMKLTFQDSQFAFRYVPQDPHWPRIPIMMSTCSLILHSRLLSQGCYLHRPPYLDPLVRCDTHTAISRRSRQESRLVRRNMGGHIQINHAVLPVQRKSADGRYKDESLASTNCICEN